MSNPERENPNLVLVFSWFSQEHSFLAQWRKPSMPWLCLGAPLSVVRWYDMVGLVWVTKSFRTILWRWYLYHSCIVWSGCQESDQTLQRTSVQCLHSIASTRVLWSESEWSPSKDLNRSLSQICRCHCEALATSWSPSSASTLWSYHCWEHTSKKAGVWALSNILHLSQNFWLRTQNPLCVFEDCIANFITDMSKYCQKFPPIYSLLGYLVEYFKCNAGQQNGNIALYYISLLSGLGNI